jgi:hypothetical protein
MKIVMLVLVLLLLSSCKGVDFDPRTSIIKYIVKESREKKISP